jgi:hypothetical protein
MPSAAIKITGIKELNKALRKGSADLPKKVRLALNEASADIAKGAAAKVPKRTGRAAASYKVRSTRTAARIVMGGNKAPYTPWLDFGGHVGKNKSVERKFYTDGRYLFPTLAKQKPEFTEKLLRLLVEIAAEAGFEETT